MKKLLTNPPMKHQLTGIARRNARPRSPSDDDVFAWLMDMGTGKSYVLLLEYVEYLAKGEIVDLLVVAPAGSYRNWFVDKDPNDPAMWSELRKHVPPATLAKIRTFGWVSGGGRKYKAELEKFLSHDGQRAFFVNVEALSNVEAAREACKRFLHRGRALLAHDESTSGKNPTAKRTKFLNRVLAPMAPARRILTGLLTPRSPMDAYAQFEFLDWRILGFRSFYAFRARYAITKKMSFGGGRPVEIIVGYRNQEELQKKIAAYSYRVLKKDCLDLEDKVYTVWEVEPTEEQRRLYNEMKNFATTAIGEADHVTATIVIAQITRMHQILCGHVTDELGNLHEVPTKRLDELVKILENHSGKAIIWTHYVPALMQIVAKLEKEFGEGCTAQFHGGNRNTRHEDERRFLNDPECRFMVATQSAGGRGNTWVVADLVVYYSNADNLEHRDQSEDRAHRKGQVNKVTYVDMMVPNTVEVKIINSLRKKINMATAITGENYREWLV
jgi:hypothetical protein